ncbi:patatin-like phospholipase family protein [Deinococcus aluminii]|uniref:PNPLA domain-containing protein n=1 Tax=Deinococcus aluminii TaxID=1656885 RepID=A0ABP9XG01_9DEIO
MTPQDRQRALVLGGGGVTGIAWGTGFLAGLHREGLDLSRADLTVGTSAGSVVGSQLAGGADLEGLLARQLEPSSEPAATFDAAEMGRLFQAIVQEVGSDPLRIRRRIGELALAAPSVPEAERVDIIASRLVNREWPRPPLQIVAVDAGSGEERVFDRDSGVPLVLAVAASCAVPGVWPPVTIGEHRYMDGGVRSVTNADLASGYGRVLVLSLLGLEGAQTLPLEAARLRESGAAVHVVGPDAASLEAIGPNVLDPARRPATAQAGLEQGRRLAAEIKAFWEGASP